jgi:hypothetical protein
VSTLTAVGDPAIDAELTKRVAASKPVAPPLPPLPPPEIPWRDATAAELASCRSAAGLLKKARGDGWAVQARFARGPYIGAKDGQPLYTVDSMVLLFRWTWRLEAYATWYRRDDEWKLGSAYQIRPHVALGGNELGHWLCGTEPAPPKPKKPKKKKESA